MFWKRHPGLAKENEELKERIRQQEEEIAYLKFKLQEFQETTFGGKKRKRHDGDENPTGEPEPKKPGAPTGHPGWFRKKPDHISQRLCKNTPLWRLKNTPS